MPKLIRDTHNPIILPSNNDWEKKAAFNGSVTYGDNTFHMVYRAQSATTYHKGQSMSISTIGKTYSNDGINFKDHKQFIMPEEKWEMFGCEDPRITYFENNYYIFYTALSGYPFNAESIKVGLAISNDLSTITAKHPITPFNAKAMALFPERINGKITAILSANTDKPPSKIAIAYFDNLNEIWNNSYWDNWYKFIDDHTLSLQKDNNGQVEVGAVPLKTENGWLLIYSYIKNYFSEHKIFAIEAVLLDHNDPFKVIGRSSEPLLFPEEEYEKFGEVQNIVFPTGAVIQGEFLNVYYGAADTSTCLARIRLSELLADMLKYKIAETDKPDNKAVVKKFEENPILTPLSDNPWENKAVFNPAAIYEDNKVHLIYRAMSENNQSVFGYAVSNDGFHISERLPDPIYVPREIFEKNTENSNAGCEDPRITKINDRFYMLYTAYDGHNPPRVAITSIAVSDFIARRWHWSIPKLISLPEKDDKDACIFPRKINDKYVFLHRLQSSIWIDYANDLHFYDGIYLGGSVLMESRNGMWDSGRIGISSVPIETDKGWLLLYHGIDENHHYHVSASLLDINNPSLVLSRLDYPILSPIMHYEKEGQVPNVVFPCGSIVLNETIFIYYGGGDSVLCVGTIGKEKLLMELVKKIST